MKNRTENISVRYRPQHLTKSQYFIYNFFMENKWGVLLTLEFLAWSVTVFMFYARYKMQSSFWFKAASVMLLFTGVIPQVLLGIVNYIANREVDLFTLVVGCLIIYGLTIGKGHIKRIDAWAKIKFSKKRLGSS